MNLDEKLGLSPKPSPFSVVASRKEGRGSSLEAKVYAYAKSSTDLYCAVLVRMSQRYVELIFIGVFQNYYGS